MGRDAVFFQQLAERLRANASADLEQATDKVEIEVYPGGTGVIRTYAGWYPISEFFSRGELRFHMDREHPVPPNELDRRIIQRADSLFTSEAMWNRADNRKCPEGAKTLSIYCACEKATVEVTGGFHHRRPALELVRIIVEQRSQGKPYSHRLMDYNNDPATTLADVHSLFHEALAQIK